MARFLRGGRITLNLGLALLLIGMAGLLVLAWIEYLRHPGLSITAALAIRREPWATIADWCVLAGSLVALIAGGMVTLAIGSWIRRILVLPVVALPAYWWLTAPGRLARTGLQSARSHRPRTDAAPDRGDHPPPAGGAHGRIGDLAAQ